METNEAIEELKLLRGRQLSKTKSEALSMAIESLEQSKQPDVTGLIEKYVELWIETKNKMSEYPSEEMTIVKEIVSSVFEIIINDLKTLQTGNDEWISVDKVKLKLHSLYGIALYDEQNRLIGVDLSYYDGEWLAEINNPNSKVRLVIPLTEPISKIK